MRNIEIPVEYRKVIKKINEEACYYIVKTF